MDFNATDLKTSTIKAKKKSPSKIGITFIVFIILQSYLVPLIYRASDTDINKYVNYIYFNTIISYALIVFSILIFHNNGLTVFQDYFSLGIIVLTCFFRASLGVKNEIIFKGALVFLGIILLSHIIANRKTIKIPSLKSVLVGVLWSIGTVMAGVLLRILLGGSNHGSLPTNVATYAINSLIFQLSFVTVIEEAYFRGLLFGLLVMYGLKENLALFIQALLFWGIHYVKISDPILFFSIIPLLTISETLIIKKYKMLYLTIIIHTVNNVLGGVLVAFF